MPRFCWRPARLFGHNRARRHVLKWLACDSPKGAPPLRRRICHDGEQRHRIAFARACGPARPWPPRSGCSVEPDPERSPASRALIDDAAELEREGGRDRNGARNVLVIVHDLGRARPRRSRSRSHAGHPHDDGRDDAHIVVGQRGRHDRRFLVRVFAQKRERVFLEGVDRVRRAAFERIRCAAGPPISTR